MLQVAMQARCQARSRQVLQLVRGRRSEKHIIWLTCFVVFLGCFMVFILGALWWFLIPTNSHQLLQLKRIYKAPWSEMLDQHGEEAQFIHSWQSAWILASSAHVMGRMKMSTRRRSMRYTWTQSSYEWFAQSMEAKMLTLSFHRLYTCTMVCNLRLRKLSANTRLALSCLIAFSGYQDSESME